MEATSKYMSERQELMEITPLCVWEKIYVGEVYHVPPVMNLPRMDILIISKNDYCLKYKRVDKPNESNIIETMYKACVSLPFMVKPKLPLVLI